ncbi:MAG: hypothetical protein IJO59_01045 [Clostridia bacterium]|nr:hypothetical protein [Clostridia bacterium]
MSKLKSLLLSGIGAVAVAAVAIGGTLAYLQDDDSDVNVMTLGNVQIDQLEYERVVDQDGNWVPLTTTDKYGYTPDELQDYTQDKPLYPAVFADGSIKWDDRNGSQEVSGPTSHQQSWAQIGASGSNQLFDDSVKNALDKFVFVKNTGKSDAYVRTWFAFEQGSVTADNFADVIMTNSNRDHWSWETVATDVDIDGNRYVVKLATYLGPKSNPTGVLAPGAVSYPSLLQVYMKPEATNEDCAAIDGNKNGTYDILVFSQAIQTAGFEAPSTYSLTNPTTAAEVALIEGFGTEHPWDGPIHFPGYVYDQAELEAALNDGVTTVKLGAPFALNGTVTIPADTTIVGGGYALTRADGFTGTMIQPAVGTTLTLENIVLDGGSASGVTATGNLVAASNNSNIVLGEGAILQNNDGAHAVNLGTRIGATLTLNGGEIINNRSGSGAVWGGGHITINSGKINGNTSTGIGGAIRMVGNCHLTMNGGEICNNTAASDGGAIWGYGASTYTFNGGKMNGNTSDGVGGAIYTGTYSTINLGGDFELCNNQADNSGAIRLTDHTSLTMTGGTVSGNTQNGESNAFNTWNNSITITGGKLADNVSYVGGLGLTIGNAEIDGVISYNLSTNHNTAYLKKDFASFEFTVNEAGEHFANFNFKPEDGYTYTTGDESKLVCLNNGYVTYWDAVSGTFRLKAE